MFSTTKNICSFLKLGIYMLCASLYAVSQTGCTGDSSQDVAALLNGAESKPLLSLVSGNGQIIAMGGTKSSALAVRLTKDGVGVTGETIKFELTSSGETTLVTTSESTGGDGLAQSFIVSGSSIETVTIAASWGSQSVLFTIQVTDGQDNGGKGPRLLVVSGDNQSTPINVALSNWLTVQALNGSQAVSGATVAFIVTSGPGGVLSASSVSTDSNGLASVRFTAGSVSGDVVISAIWSDKTMQSAKFKIKITQDQMSIVSGNGQVGDPLSSFLQPLVVSATQLGVPAAGQTISFRVYNGGVPVTLSAQSAVTGSNGQASITVQGGSTDGLASVQASWNGITQDFTLSVSSNNALAIVGGNAQSSSPGSQFGAMLEVRATKNGQIVPGASVSFTVLSGATGTLSASTATTNSSGIAQTNVTPSAGSSGAMVIRAVYGSATADFNLTVIDQIDTVIAKISGDNQAANYNTVLSDALVVEVRKASTNALQSNVVVRFQLTAGNGTINSTSNIVDVSTDASGRASVAFRVGTLKTNTITATILNNPSQSVTFTELVTITSATTVDLATTAITLTPNTIQADGATTTIAKVTLKDQYGNIIPATDRTIVFSTGAGTWAGGVVNNNDGSYQRTLIAPTSVGAGSTTVSATYQGGALTSPPATLTFASGAFSTSTSTTSTTTSIIANGTSTTTVTVTLKDALGNQLMTGGRTVVITASGGTWVSGIVDNNNGTYTRTLRSATLAQTVTLSTTVDGVPLQNNGTVAFLPGTADATKSVITVSPSSIVPNGVATSTVTVWLRDANHNPLVTGGATVTINSTAGSFSSGVTDLANGTYTRTLVAAAAPATATISATLDGVALIATARVYMTNTGAGPSTARSTLTSLSSTTQPADGTTTIVVKVTLRDSSNNQLTSGGSNVAVSTTSGTLLGSVVDNGDGTYSQILRAPTSSAVSSVTATVDSLPIAASLTISWYGAFSVATSTVSSTPSAIDADGTSQVLLMIQAKDSNSISIPVGGVTGLAFGTTAGVLQGSLVDNGNGTYTQNIRAPSSGSPINATISASKSGVALSSTASLQFYPSTNLAGVTIDCANIATYSNRPILVDGGVLTMNSSGNAAGSPCPGSFVFSNVIVRNSGKITHSATTSTVEYGLDFTADNVSVDASSSIDVSVKGYRPVTANRFRVKGNVDALFQNNTIPGSADFGASHGGEPANAASGSNFTYGNPFYPMDLGASGPTSDVSLGPGANYTVGGGRVKMTIQSGGTLTLNGTIQANGGAGYYNGSRYGTGAGGSILISTPTLTGTGAIMASGGTSTYNSPGAGGGRVAIYYSALGGGFALSSIHTTIKACGGTSNPVTTYAGPGTVFLKQTSQTYGDMVMANCGNTNAGRTPLNAPAALIPQNLNATTITSTGSFGDNYGTTSPYVGYWVDPNTAQNSSGFFTHSLFKISTATANNVTIASGDLTTIATNYTTQNTQMVFVFDRMEVRDATNVTSPSPVVVTNGDLSSGSTTTMNWRGLMPSNLELPNATTVTYDGTSYSALTSSLTQRLNSSVNLTLKNSTFTSTAAMSMAGLTLDGANLTVLAAKGSNAITLSGNLTLQNSANLYQQATTTTTEYALSIVAAGLNVGTGSTISAKGRGYPALPGSCYTLGLQIPANSTYCSGHGGMNGVSGSTNGIYGSIQNPSHSGSGGSYGAGGGIIRIDIGSGAATIDGTIDAGGGGFPGSYNWENYGAGGSVYLNVGSISGSGNVAASGMDSNQNSNNSPGGGRIAIYYQSTAGGFAYPSTILNRLKSYAGTPTANGVRGGGGTIYLKGSSQTYGDLIIDNDAASPSGRSSYIKLASRTSQSLTSTTLTDTGQFLENGQLTKHLVGMYLNPNTAQNATYTMNDDTLCKIIGQTADTLEVTGCNLTSLATSGDTYRVVLVLDHLSINNYGQLHTDGSILVKSGDVTSGNNDALMSTTSYLKGSGVVEFANVRNLRVYGQSGGAITPGHVNASGTVTFNTGTWSLPEDITAAGLISLVNGVYNFTAEKGITSTGGGLTIDNSTVTMGKLKGATAINVTGALTLQNTASLVQLATTLAAEYSLEINAGSANIANGSIISAVGKGYVIQSTINNLTTSFGNVAVTENGGTPTGTRMGGSHGGRGGADDNSASCNTYIETYGSLTNPYESGAAGKASSASWENSSGGGIIRLNTGSGDIVVNGIVSASGDVVGANGGLGAGGSILISGANISGTGSLRVNGSSSTNNVTAGGGGGRLALYYQTLSGGFTYPSNIFSRVQAFGGTTGNNKNCANGSAGTIYLKSQSQTYGDVIIANNNVTTAVSTVINMPSNSTSTSVSSTTLTKSNSFKDAGLYSTGHLAGFMLNPNTGQNSTATLNDDTMYRITVQDDHTLTTAGNLTATGSGGNTYQVVLVLDNLEVRDGARVQSPGQILVRNGDISSNDTTSVTMGGGFTSTNLEWLNVSSTIFNPGSGRTIFTNSLTTTGDVTVQSGTVRIPNLTVGGNVNITGGTLESGDSGFSPNMIVTGDVTLTGGSTLAPIAPGSSGDSRLYVTAANIGVCSTCSISATSRGYSALNFNVSRCVGNSDYINRAANDGWFGGSHGGQGNGGGNGAGDVHGVFTQPTDLGCSAAPGSWTGTAGGGAIRIVTPGTLTVNGTIASNGGDAGTNMLAGSGGSLYIQANTLTGATGTIKARGGNSPNHYAGGGGRIAIYYASASGQFSYPTNMVANVTAEGGLGNGGNNNGAAGTIYLKDTVNQTYGDLIINNLNLTTPTNAQTAFSVPSVTTSAGITSLSLSRASGFSNNQFNLVNWLGFYLNPNTAQNATGKISDDTLFYVTSNTANALTVSAGDMTSVATAGSTFRMALVLDNLDVINKARFDFTGGQIRVLSGDVSGNNATSFSLDGVLKAHTLDLGTGVTYSGTANATKTVTYECISGSCP